MQKVVYNKFRKVVYEATGINLGQKKDTLVAARVGKRMRALGITDYRDYLGLVLDDASGEEMRQLVDAICTNVTSFFREEDHFALVREAVRDRLAAGQKRIRIWSAACSTGEEVYSLAIALHGLAAAVPGADLRILGTDLSTKALRTAMLGQYSAARVAGVHPKLRTACFTRRMVDGETTYTVRPVLREAVTFRQLNLARPPFPMNGPIDVVLCRNVMIYFDDKVRQGLLREIDRLLAPGGHLLVGHAESLSGTRRFVCTRPSVYMKA